MVRTTQAKNRRTAGESRKTGKDDIEAPIKFLNWTLYCRCRDTTDEDSFKSNKEAPVLRSRKHIYIWNAFNSIPWRRNVGILMNANIKVYPQLREK